MKATEKHSVYFLGIGGIGMSALARHFKNMGKNVAGFDRTQTTLTKQLESEGIDIHYDDDITKVPTPFFDKNNALIVFTPAIPKEHRELNYFLDHNFELVKRAYALGLVSNDKKGIAVSGTHGKTSVSTFTAHLLKNSQLDCSAFLGGISKNHNTNYFYSEKSDFVVVEADEFDRSFLQLRPFMAVVTAIDADHLEIYENKENIISSFNEFVSQVDKGGILLIHSKLKDIIYYREVPKYFTYSMNDRGSDFYAKNILLKNGLFQFDLNTPQGDIENLLLGVPGNVNLENAVAAVALAFMAGVGKEEIRNALPRLKGVKRRLDMLYRSDRITYIDDYAHHPEEIKRFLESIREIYPDKRITGIFQPHLFTRTRDLAGEFAHSLSLLDSLYLLDIYPARELPIPGVTSEIILRAVNCKQKVLCNKQEVISKLKNIDCDVLVTMGAGDIDTLTEPIVNLLIEQEK